jgi:DNA-binding NarL/FixJ family response regulator
MYEGEEFIQKIRDIFRVANEHLPTDVPDLRFSAYWKEYQTYDTGPELTSFQLLLLTKYCEQKTSKEIAAEMNMSVGRIESHRMVLQQKLGVSNTAGLILFALQKGIFIS